MGRAAGAPDPDRYEHQYAHCDVLVIGGGPAGLAAARTAAQAGARVIVCQQSAHFGARLLGTDATIGDRPASAWVEETVSELAAQPDVILLPRTTAFGYYDDNLVGAVERVTDHLATPPEHLPRQRMWMIRAKAVVLASGAIERGIAYANNDLPGTMLAGAAVDVRQALWREARNTRGRLHEQRWRLRGRACVARDRRRDRGDRRRATRSATRRSAACARTRGRPCAAGPLA